MELLLLFVFLGGIVIGAFGNWATSSFFSTKKITIVHVPDDLTDAEIDEMKAKCGDALIVFTRGTSGVKGATVSVPRN